MIQFKMPALGADMEAGTLVSWHVKEGDEVRRGDIIADVETDKGLIEIEVWIDGKVSQLLIEPGKKVPVGTALAVLTGEEPLAPLLEVPSIVPSEAAEPRLEPAVATAQALPTERLRISPLARKLAAEWNINLAELARDTHQSVIDRAELEAYLHSHRPEAKESSKADVKLEARSAAEKGKAMQRAIAAAMSRSKKEIPHYYLQTTVKMQKALEWLDQLNAGRSLNERILPAALYIRSIAQACQVVPEMNGFYTDGDFKPSQAVHIGMAIALRGGGLVAPAILHVEQKNLAQVMKEMLDLVSRARSGRLRSSEFADPTITLTNLGETGVESVFGVIYPPQVALLGMGRIEEQPVAVGSLLGIAPVLSISLAADHRVTDGHRGAVFLNELKRVLEHPEQREA